MILRFLCRRAKSSHSSPTSRYIPKRTLAKKRPRSYGVIPPTIRRGILFATHSPCSASSSEGGLALLADRETVRLSPRFPLWVDAVEFKKRACRCVPRSADTRATLTGAGGSGKTLLAVQVATDLVDRFHDGVWWIELAPLMDELLVPSVIAKALGVRGEEPADGRCARQLDWRTANAAYP